MNNDTGFIPLIEHSSGAAAPSVPGPWRATQIALVVVAVLLFAATRWYVSFEMESKSSDVDGPYFAYATRAYDLRQVPYRENFTIEYPPVAWWAIYVPRLVGRPRVVNPRDAQEVAPVLTTYRTAFRREMLLLDAGAFGLLIAIVRRRRACWVGWAALTYTVVTAILANVLYDRLDIGLTFLLFLWSYCWIRSLDESGSAIAWTGMAYAALGLSISFKLIPIITVPFLLLAEWRTPRWQSRLTMSLAAVGTAACLPFAIQSAVSGSGVFKLFEYHSDRGIEIESLYSTLMMIASLFGSPIFVSYGHGAYELSGALAADMKTLSTVMLCGVVSAMAAWAIWLGARYGRLDAYRVALLVMCAAAAVAKVLSPQYFLWTLPMILLLAAELLPPRWPAWWSLAGIVSAVSGMTTWIFPYHFYRKISGNFGLVPASGEDRSVLFIVPCLVLGLRNFGYLAVVTWLGVLLFRRTGNTDATPDRPSKGLRHPA